MRPAMAIFLIRHGHKISKASATKAVRECARIVVTLSPASQDQTRPEGVRGGFAIMVDRYANYAITIAKAEQK